jgi:hypothetical protein
LLGQSDLKLTERYNHLSESELKQASSRIRNGSNILRGGGTMEKLKNKACTPPPAPLIKVSYGKKPRETTTLRKWLNRENWTPGQAAMLVCGLCPYPECEEIPAKGTGVWTLRNTFRWGNTDPCNHARQILNLWNAQENPPDKVSPDDFVLWCKANTINTDSIRDVKPVAETRQEGTGNDE